MKIQIEIEDTPEGGISVTANPVGIAKEDITQEMAKNSNAFRINAAFIAMVDKHCNDPHGLRELAKVWLLN